jgi:Protein of unknown function (DUF3147)
MKIKINTDGLSQSEWYEYVIRFGFGGTVTALAGIIAKEFGPAVGGLFLAFPAIFPATATLIEKHEKKKKECAGQEGAERGRAAAGIDAAGSSMGAIGLIFFGLIVWQLLPRFATGVVLIIASVTWFVISVLVWEGRERLWRRWMQQRKATRTLRM